MKKAYICSPFRTVNDFEMDRNIDYAQTLTKKALRDGFAPITPHLYLTQCLNEMNPYERNMGLEAGLALLEACDMLILGLNYGISDGMNKEIVRAKELGIDILKY